MEYSLDGFVGTLSGGLDWAFRHVDHEYADWAIQTLWQAGVHIMGGTTGREMAKHWPSSKSRTPRP